MYCEENGLAGKVVFSWGSVGTQLVTIRFIFLAQIGTQPFTPNHYGTEPLVQELPKLTLHSSFGDHSREVVAINWSLRVPKKITLSSLKSSCPLSLVPH